MGRKWLAWLLTAALLLSMPVIALGEAQSKSWDIGGNYLYGIIASNGGYMTVTDDPENADFGEVQLWSAERVYPEEMRGEWTLKKLSGDPLEVEIGSEGDAHAGFHLTKGEAKQSAEYLVTFSSKELQNDVCLHINVFVISKDNEYANDYVYDKTEHEIKTGKRYTIPAGHTLPLNAELYRDIEFDGWNDSEENGYAEINYSTGEITACFNRAGTYHVYVSAILMDNIRKEITHTIVVTGEPTDGEIPDEMDMWLDRDYIARLSDGDNTDERYICDFHLNDDWAWRNDEIEWSVEQVKGEDAHIYLRNYGDEGEDNCNGGIYIDGLLPIGEYVFKIAVDNKTRDLHDSVNLTITVEDENPGEQLPEMIYYKKIEQGSVITLKAGKTLSFGNPILYPSNATIPDDHEFGVWIDGYEGDWERDMIVKRDFDKGAHVLRGAKEGSYEVHAYLNMYGNSRGMEIVFTLNVESAGAKVDSITFDKHGDWDNPYPVVLGKSVKVKATVLPKNAKLKTLKWESEYPEGVSVNDKGVITGNELWSTALVRAYATDGSDVEQYIVVRVVPEYAAKVSIPKKLKMNVGDSKFLNVKIKPASVKDEMKYVVWESDNSAVAEVGRNSGEIIANAPGTANIYVYAVDYNMEVNMKVFAKCKVTVK